MNSNGKKALFGAALLWTAGILVWPGCVTPPIPPRREAVASRKKSDFKWMKCEHPTRTEMTGRLGEPDAYFSDLRVACYAVNKVTHRRIWLLLGVIPLGTFEIKPDLDVAFIEFDEQDHVLRYAIGTAADMKQLGSAARRWIEPKTGS